MLEAKCDGTFGPDLDESERAVMRRAAAIIKAMARVGIPPLTYTTANHVGVFVTKYCQEPEKEAGDAKSA